MKGIQQSRQASELPYLMLRKKTDFLEHHQYSIPQTDAKPNYKLFKIV